MKIGVVDGQGGGFGKLIVEKIRKLLNEDIHIIALGTNSAATTLMLRAGANEGATGENAIIYNIKKVDLILGPIGIICANSLLGELTPSIARAVSESEAKKVLIPLNKSNIYVAGIEVKPLPHYIDDLIELVKKECENCV